MSLRYLERIAISEYAAEVLEEALEFHLGRLKRTMDEERDRADRIAWSRAQHRRNALHAIWSNVRSARRDLGPIAPEALEDIAQDIERRSYEMPRSAANAEALKAQRAARKEAMEAQKAALREERKRHRRVQGIGPEA